MNNTQNNNNNETTKITGLLAKERYNEYYTEQTSYNALWHLFAIGVIENRDTYASSAWDKAEERMNAEHPQTIVAMIDNSVDRHHPNLKKAIDTEKMVDFVSAPLGAFLSNTFDITCIREDLLQQFKKEEDDVHETVNSIYNKLITRLKDVNDKKYNIRPAISPRFSAHGTSIAGLIGARPVNKYPYTGVDPYCKIVPISTSFDADPEQYIAALIYAYIINAQVIVLPRDFAHPWETPISKNFEEKEQKKKEQKLLLDSMPSKPSADEEKAWKALSRVLIIISRFIPIVCAAGNEAHAPVIYPARLADEDNGIISVGAFNFHGGISGFSPIGKDITIYAPSGDAQRLDNEVVKLDKTDIDVYRHKYAEEDFKDGINDNPLSESFAYQEVVTTDGSGRFGYNNSQPGQQAPSKEHLYYSLFSGTSAASAIVAGFISLGISAGNLGQKNGIQIKQALLKNVKSKFPKLCWKNIE